MPDSSERGKVLRWKIISRERVRANRHMLFVFGDNMEGRGYGGQAAAMRGEPNSVGIPTKWKPEMTPSAFFTDHDWTGTNADVRAAISGAFDRLERALAEGHDVVIPADGIGTGLAQLDERAPLILRRIEAGIAALAAPPEEPRKK